MSIMYDMLPSEGIIAKAYESIDMIWKYRNDRNNK